MAADRERMWLLEMEEALCAETVKEEEAGIDLNEVYERLEEMEADKAENRAACILSGLG
jgi:ATPase subunit of ABC transporter with duplicated ATPase domains